MDKNIHNIDDYIFGILIGEELKEFEKKLIEVPVLTSKVNDRESEIIEEYLRGKLPINLAQKIENRIKSDKRFERKVLFEKSIISTAKKIERRKEYENEINKIKKKIELEKEAGIYTPLLKGEKKTKIRSLFKTEIDNGAIRKLFIFSISIAATILILLTVFIPIGDKRKIDKYLAESNKIWQTDIKKIGNNGERELIETDSIVHSEFEVQSHPQSAMINLDSTKQDSIYSKWIYLEPGWNIFSSYIIPYNENDIDTILLRIKSDTATFEDSLPNLSEWHNMVLLGKLDSLKYSIINATIDSLKYSIINDERLIDRYFIKDNILYTNFQTKSEIKVFSRINSEGQAEYFICNGKEMFKFSKNIENKILNFETVIEQELIRYCE